MGNCASTEGGQAQPETNTQQKPENTSNTTNQQSPTPKPEKKLEQKDNDTNTNDGVNIQTQVKEDNEDHPSTSRIIDPVDVDIAAPRPTTASPHTLPRNEEDQTFDPAETKKQLHPFRNGVARVLYQRRIWSRLSSELDAAEEMDLLNKVDFHRTLTDGQLTLSVSKDKKDIPNSDNNDDNKQNEHSRTPTSRPKAINAPKQTTKEKLSKRRVYQKYVDEHKIDPKDIYGEMEYASDDYLWNLTYAQHKCRASNAKQPITGTIMRNGRQFDLADVPPLDENSEITEEWIAKLLSEFRQGKILSQTNAFHLCRKAVATLLPEKNCPDLKIPRDAVCTVVGDLHGQLDDLLMIFREAGSPTSKHRMLFNGDFVDRGVYSTEIVWVLFAYRILYPDYFYLNRGNHECSDMNAFDGFQKECELKYSIELYWLVNHVFAALPVAHLVTVGQQRVFVVHAGLSFEDFTIDEINAENRYLTSYPMNSILQDLIWSDPFDGVGRQLSRRGAGCQFGIDVVQSFLVKNNVHLIIRSHECEDNGFSLWFNNRLYTIFSASNYCGDSGNYGAFCVLSNSPSPQIRVYSAKQQVAKYSERQVQIRQTLLSKLLVRIASRIFDIEKLLLDLSEKRGTPGKIPPYVWSYALYKILNLDAAYLPLATKLGVNVDAEGKVVGGDKLTAEHNQQTYTSPYADDDRATRQLTFIQVQGEVATNIDGKVLIDVAAWVNKFRPKELARDDLQGRIAALLYDTTSPFMSGLEQLFKHFDQNGDGFISTEELTLGLTKILEMMGADTSVVTPEAIDALIEKIDLDDDGEIDSNEFFKAFAYGTLDIQDTAITEF